MTEPPAPQRSPAPPPSAAGRRQLLLGTLTAFMGIGAVVLGSWPLGVSLALLGGLFAGLGALVSASSDAVPLVNMAHNALLEGRVADAERLLDRVEGRSQIGYIRRAVDLQRASIALRRGDLDGALARAEAALARKPWLLTRRQEGVHLAASRAMRALIRASIGDHEGARVDAAAVRALPDVPVEALARAEVAEAIALERSGDRDALAAHLASRRALLLDATVPRERAIVRAYQRMLKAPRTSVYRRGATRDAAEVPDGEPTVADWIARLAPAAAPFARPPRGRLAAAAPALEEAVEPGLLRIAEDRLKPHGVKRPMRGRLRLLALWVVLTGLFASLWTFINNVDDPPALFERSPGVPLDLLAAALIPLLLGLLAVVIARNLRHDRRLAAALGALARGDERTAAAELEVVARSPYSVASAQAHLHLARLAERRGDFDETLKHCDEGIAAVTPRASTRSLASAILLPDLVAERAFVLAVMDRRAKANAEMASLARTFPAYPYLARAELRVALVQRARGGDLAGAAQLAAGVTDDLPLSLRDEALVDLVRAAAHPETAGAGEVERLTEELRVDADLRRWLTAVAPDVVRGFEGRAGAAESDAEAEAEHEALAAEEEAEEAVAGLRTVRL